MLQKIVFYFAIVFALAVAGIAALMAYLIAALLTSQIVVTLGMLAVVYVVICFGLARSLAGMFSVRHPGRVAAVVCLVSAAVIAAIVAYPTLQDQFSPVPNPASDAVISALQQRTIALNTVQVGSGFDDLQPLTPILAGKRIVALGEATHGTREFFQMKHRLLEFLVTELGFENFGMETGVETAQALNDYIQGGSANPKDVLYWPWATTEVMAMLDWMRAYNADPRHPRQLTFYGFDPIVGDRDPVMADNVRKILDQLGPQSKIVLWAHNAHISNGEGWMGRYLKQQFGDQAYLLGFEFDHGEFTSRMVTVLTYHAEPASPAYYAYALAKTGKPIQFLDFRTLSQDPGLAEWLKQDLRSHEFAELHAVYRLQPAWHTLYTSWLNLYDGVIFIEQSTPAEDLR